MNLKYIYSFQRINAKEKPIFHSVSESGNGRAQVSLVVVTLKVNLELTILLFTIFREALSTRHGKKSRVIQR